MGKEKKYMYCPCCEKFPDNIVEIYPEGKLEEKRKWDGDCYELTDSNLDKLECIQICEKCKMKLEYKE